ncbi:AsmA family protein [Rhizobium cremeum]|uniref:AsmA family protein n=1 Tax=Rhizobium cremeum TaxID=2813827 RepID=UPI000DDEB827|nr:AsmA-like C-terminal region-containing protein [Rhizobium cremeum]MCJ7997441.1 AsmA family protein [Rhizobium cremeum]MCJ8002535.1 AsmA family protein [Rhizobium cremeum]
MPEAPQTIEPKKAAPRRSPVRRALRIALALLSAALLVFVISRAAAPYLISSGLVRSAMERAVAQWTGHRVSIEGTPEIVFWPEPRVTLNAVTISKQTESGRKVLGRVEKLSASFGLYSAIQGRPRFKSFHFLKPEVFVDRDKDGRLDWASEGLLSAAVRQVASQAGGGQALSGDLDAPVGSITVENGSVRLTDAASGRDYALEGIAADISWPRLSGTLEAEASLTFAGRQFKLDFSSPQPLLLFGGKTAAMAFSLDGAAFSSAFEGVAGMGRADLGSGDLNLNLKDVPALLDWAGVKIAGLDKLKAASLRARLSRVENELRFDGLEFVLDDIRGSGILGLSRPKNGKPLLSGTLAFDRLNIADLLSSFSLDLPNEQPRDEARQPRLTQWLDFDLTLSASQAALPPFDLGDVAASILLTGKTARFDIADAAFEGGDITASYAGAEGDFSGGGSLTLAVRNADFGAVIDRMQIKGPLPRGRGSVDLALKTEDPLWATDLSEISGKLSFTTENGVLQAIDSQKFRELAATKAYYQLSAAGGEAGLPYNRLEFVASFGGGSAEIDKARLIGPNETLILSGIVPYEDKALAVSGDLFASDPARRSELPRMRFFVGGSWPDPVISPVQMPAEALPPLPGTVTPAP